jgi:hypothetical protein
LHPTLFWMAQGLIQEYNNKVEVGQVWCKLWTMKTKKFLGGTYLHLKETNWKDCPKHSKHPKHSQHKPRHLRFLILWNLICTKNGSDGDFNGYKMQKLCENFCKQWKLEERPNTQK